MEKMHDRSDRINRRGIFQLGAGAGLTLAAGMTGLGAQETSARGAEQAGAGAGDAAAYIFGYGSLMEKASRTSTWPDAVNAVPAIVDGIERGWFDQVETVGYTTTYSGAIVNDAARCTGVLFPVTEQGLQQYIARETGYDQVKIDPSRITILDGSASTPTADIWYFATHEPHDATADIPIVQSYVDVCVNGCLEMEAAFPLAKQQNFAELFFRLSTHWSPFWVNDRIYPRRPFVYSRNAYAIDSLIQKVLGKDVLAGIRIE